MRTPPSRQSGTIAMLLAVTAVLAAPATAGANVEQTTVIDTTPALDVDYVPTPMPTVRLMLEMADVKADDHVVDLGSGDGRILVTAASQYGVRSAIGVELDPWLVQWARARADEAGVGDRVRFIEADLFETDFADADVVTMYLLPQINLRLRPYILTRLSPGTRIVSHSFDMGDWQPDARAEMYTKPIFMWVVPAQVAGTWKIERKPGDPPLMLQLHQQFQHLEGNASVGGNAVQVDDLQLSGRDIRFRIGDDVFEGRVEGGTMHSTGALPWTAQNR